MYEYEEDSDIIGLSCTFGSFRICMAGRLLDVAGSSQGAARDHQVAD